MQNKKTKNKRRGKFDSPLPGCIASTAIAVAASRIYTSAVGARNYFYDRVPSLSRELSRPVISVGGIRAGGVGKTPVAQLIGRYVIEKRGYGAAFLSRGYGRVSKRPVVVNPREEVSWEDVGDEPCMIRGNVPESWLGIGADRSALARMLSPRLPEKSVFILDDGFQRRQVRRDLEIVCVSGSVLDDRMLPAGYLREPVSSLARAGVVLVVGQEDHIDMLEVVKSRLEGMFAGRVFAVLLYYPLSWVNGMTGESYPAGAVPAALRGAPAVAGIARPERFIAMLRGLSVEPPEVRIFPDHYKYKKKDFLFCRNIYCNGDVKSVVTTEKDFARLRAREFADVCSLWYLKTGLRFADAGSEARVYSAINSITQ